MRALGIVTACVLLAISAALAVLVSAGDTSLVNLGSVANALATVTASPTVEVGVSLSATGVPQLERFSGTIEMSSQQPGVAIDRAGGKVGLGLFVFYDRELVATLYSIAPKAYLDVDLAPLAPLVHGAAQRRELSLLESRFDGRWWELPGGAPASAIAPSEHGPAEAALVHSEEDAVARSSTVASAEGPGRLLRIDVQTPLSALVEAALPFAPALLPGLGKSLPSSIPATPSLGQLALGFYLDHSATLREVTGRAAIGPTVLAAGVAIAHRDVEITTPPDPRRLTPAAAGALSKGLRALEPAAPALSVATSVLRAPRVR